ncbi:ABC transporter substrate-binding protein [Burkholderia mallei]|uniref:Uncharacterized protein n=3 Tax=pseudomallei group TaxID=111527 RepID=A0A0H3HMK5_BURP2|nr:conserved domain protein [Burkholderia mallei ATCC 23344]AFI67182.1 hypothetical protein BP1026B_I2587 [Burkholderia pseudomallei 1026b]AUG21964.1 ABC transporter substrate-binding protein [Burkholderia pseudomallei]EIF55624.1 hypothetical protein BP1026A_5046 [Burkholderia pseudomallei 1026a]RKN90792.1 ABC transporter substrate-binding protein [Burkholderia mallei]
MTRAAGGPCRAHRSDGRRRAADAPRPGARRQPRSRALRRSARHRAALEYAHGLVVPNGIVDPSAADHVGLDQRVGIMGVVKHGALVYSGPCPDGPRRAAVAAADACPHGRFR